MWRGAIPSVRFYFHSNEQCGHFVPHVHVDYRHECSAVFAIEDGECLADDGFDRRVPRKTKREVKKLIKENRRELSTLWNQQTNGIRIDIDATLGEGGGGVCGEV